MSNHAERHLHLHAFSAFRIYYVVDINYSYVMYIPAEDELGEDLQDFLNLKGMQQWKPYLVRVSW